MTSWVVLISVVSGIGVIGRLALQYVVVIWSLKRKADERQHAIELLKVLQKDRPTAIDLLRAASRKIPESGDVPRDTDVGDRI